MKTVLFSFITSLALLISMPAFSNPKCSHRVATSGNDLRKNTNPPRTIATKSEVKDSKQGTKKGVR